MNRFWLFVTHSVLRASWIVLEVVWLSIFTVLHLLSNLLLLPLSLLLRGVDISRDVVLVTNCGRGLGRRVAVRFGMKAGMVVCWDPDRDRCMDTVYEIRHRGGSAVGYEVDLCDEAAIVAAAARIQREIGAVRILVLNAGRAPTRALLSFTVSEIEGLFRLNVFPHFVMLKVFVPPMVVANVANVVSICSASSILPAACDGPYVATKMALSGMLTSLQEELDSIPHNKVRITRVYPFLSRQRIHQGKIYKIQWSKQSLDIMAHHVVEGVLHGRFTISVPHCLVFCLHILKVLPRRAQHRWLGLLSRRLLRGRGRGRVLPHAAHPATEPCPWEADSCPMDWMTTFLEGGNSAPERTDSSVLRPHEMISERSSSGEVLRVGYKKPCRISIA